LKDQIEWKNKIIENFPKKIEKNSTGEIIQGRIVINYQKGNLIFSMVSFIFNLNFQRDKHLKKFYT
jgi:hypothetical protein